jgi:hypothetical protein
MHLDAGERGRLAGAALEDDIGEAAVEQRIAT